MSTPGAATQGAAQIEPALARFSKLPRFLTLLLFASCLYRANAQDAAVRLQKVAETNALDVAGKPPFHLKISFQMYDLYGNPSDAGIVEEWWAAPGKSKVVISTPSFNSGAAVPLYKATALDPRERFFVESLLQAEVHPVLFPPVSVVPPDVEEKDTAFSGVQLDCFNSAPTEDQGYGRQLFSFCSEKKTGALRFKLERSVSSMARNQIGSFHDTEVALGLEIAYQDRIAIKGKVETLQSFDPAKSTVELPAQDDLDHPVQAQPKGHLVAGKLISHVPPSYPAFARTAHIKGTVVLHIVISKNGAVNSIFALASPHPSLTAAAIDAVNQWKYQPFTLNGEPLDVVTTVNINFQMSPAATGR